MFVKYDLLIFIIVLDVKFLFVMSFNLSFCCFFFFNRIEYSFAFSVFTFSFLNGVGLVFCVICVVWFCCVFLDVVDDEDVYCVFVSVV